MLRKCTLLYALDREEEFKSYYQECLKSDRKTWVKPEGMN